MAHLKMKKNNALIQEVNLDSQQTYLVGRGETCQIRLDPEVGISRQHLQISPTPSGWTLELLSRHGELYVDGKKSSGLTMQENTHFSVPPYDFEFFTQENEPQSPSNPSYQNEFERTLVSVLPSTGYLKLIDSTGKTHQVFRLEGESWIAGRDIECNLFMNNQKINRKQFEVYHKDSHYFIRDLENTNGTLVNAHPIYQTKWTELESGDVIAIADWTLQFELREPTFQEQMDSLEPHFQRPPPHFQQKIGSATPLAEDTRQVNSSFQKNLKNQSVLNLFSLIFSIFLVVVGVYFFSKHTPFAKIWPKEAPPRHQPVNIAPEKQQIVTHSTALTRMERKESSETLKEIAHIENIKRLEKAEKEMEEKIQKQEELAAARKIEEEKIDTNAAINKLKFLYNKAINLEKKKMLPEAIAAYKVVETSKSIDPYYLKKKSAAARIGIEKIAQEKRNLSLTTADELTKNGKYKEAIITLKEALKINPENETIKDYFGQALLNLRKQLQNIYQESIIEESVGDVDSAKEKWQRIIDQSLPGENYFEKARLKLKKYGAE